MIIVEAAATVLYTCYLSDEDSEKVKEKAKELAEYYQGESVEDYFAQAVEQLYAENEIDLYEESTESDFATESINSAWEDEE